MSAASDDRLWLGVKRPVTLAKSGEGDKGRRGRQWQTEGNEGNRGTGEQGIRSESQDPCLETRGQAGKETITGRAAACTTDFQHATDLEVHRECDERWCGTSFRSPVRWQPNLLHWMGCRSG